VECGGVPDFGQTFRTFFSLQLSSCFTSASASPAALQPAHSNATRARSGSFSGVEWFFPQQVKGFDSILSGWHAAL
jgi:hypothetical protein